MMVDDSREKLDVEQLEEAVQRRRELVGQVVSLVEAFLLERGRITSRKVFSAHTCVERELRQFEGFSFYWVTGMSMFGGETIRIWYRNPGQADIEPELVFDVYYWMGPSYKVRVFTEGEWRSKFDYLMEHQVEVVERIEREKELEREQIQNERREELRVNDLREEASKLGL